jgi:hypothetical protein
MQQDDVSQKSKLKMAKKALWWVLGTVVAAPLTKWGEEQLNLSILSPVIDGVWNGIKSVGHWLGLSVSLQLWMLVAITVWALLMVGAVVWVIIDANGKLKDADTELNEADAKLKELNSIGVKLNATQAELDAHKEELNAHKEELKAAHAKIADLQVPKVAPLTDEQNKVIAAIAAFDNVDKRCITKGLPAWTELTLLQTDGALDVLEKRKLIQVLYPSSGKYATLTAGGRAYVLHPDFIPPLLLLLPPLAPEPYRNGRI